MAPKPLSEYPETVAVYTSPSPFEKVPDLVIKIARAIHTASQIEAILEMLLVEILGGAADPVAAVIRCARSASVIREMVQAAAREVLPRDEMDIFDIILAAITTAVRPRDVFSHQIWEWSPDIDGILFTHKSQAIGTSLELGRMVRGKKPMMAIDLDRSATTVFTRNDVEEALGDLRRAATLLTRFVVAKRLHDPLRAAAGDDALQKAWSQLTCEPEMVTGLSALQWNRQAPDSSKRSRRRRGKRVRK